MLAGKRLHIGAAAYRAHDNVMIICKFYNCIARLSVSCFANCGDLIRRGRGHCSPNARHGTLVILLQVPHPHMQGLVS